MTNVRKIIFNLIDFVYITSILSIALILITGGIRIDCIGLDLISLKRPITLLVLTIILKRIYFKNFSQSRIISFINTYSLKKMQFYIFLFSLFFSALISSRIVPRYLPGGDEPHFLMITSSMVKDGDINLRNNYDNGDFYEFYPDPIIPHSRIMDDTRIYSAHGAGLPLLIIPGYILGSRYGAAFIMNILFALLTVTIFSLSLLATNNRVLSLGLSFLMSFTVPLVFYSFHLYAELPGALIVSYLFLVISILPRTQQIPFLKRILIGIIIAYLPWLHIRFMIFVILILAYLWYKAGFKNSLPVIGIVMLFIGLIHIYMKILFGKLSIFAQYFSIDAGVKYTLQGLFGNMIDARFGLFLYSPYYIFLGAGLYFLYIKNRQLFFWWILFTMPLIIGVSSFYHWHGGCCPPLRYIIPVIPLFALPVGSILNIYKNKLFYILFAVLAYLSFALKEILSENTFLLVNYEYLDSRILNYLKSCGLDLYWLFPLVTEHSVKTFVLKAVWTISILLLSYAIIRDYQKKPLSHPSPDVTPGEV